ncbi:MAG: GatB/YqeY domain-containing protein [Bacteroidota bacterium]|nr:GatB/YqeY domain-containing protein [Bacteroidota bacterium]
MNLEQKVMADLKTAMLAKDEKALRALRAIKAALINLKTSGGFSGEVTGDDEIKLLQKLVKQRKESLEIYEKQQRGDLAAKEKEEIEVIERFLPQPLSAEELKDLVRGAISQSGATSPADMGKVMGLVNRQVAGRADGKTVAALVKELLGAG